MITRSVPEQVAAYQVVARHLREELLGGAGAGWTA